MTGQASDGSDKLPPSPDDLLQAWETLQDADDAPSFYQSLSMLVANAKMLPDDWLAHISTLAGRPWKRARGRPRDADRHAEIEWLFFHQPACAAGVNRLRRADAVRSIIDLYQGRGTAMTEDAAKALYDAVARDYRSKPYAISGFVVTETDDG